MCVCVCARIGKYIGENWRRVVNKKHSAIVITGFMVCTTTFTTVSQLHNIARLCSIF